MPPAGFRRSRALWDRARYRHHTAEATASTTATTLGEPSSKFRRLVSSPCRAYQTLHAYAPALLYEFQPVRYSQWWSREDLLKVLAKCAVATRTALAEDLPAAAQFIFEFVRNRPRQQWTGFAALLLYYALVRWLHEWIRAGPIVLILTAFLIIFTVGLGDTSQEGQLSAYSVFNRGMVRLMGDAQLEQLLAQHVGGIVGHAPAAELGGGGGVAGPGADGAGGIDWDDEGGNNGDWGEDDDVVWEEEDE